MMEAVGGRWMGTAATQTAEERAGSEMCGDAKRGYGMCARMRTPARARTLTRTSMRMHMRARVRTHTHTER